HHVVGMYDGSFMKVFIDGEIEDSQSYDREMRLNDHSLKIGWDPTHPNEKRYFNGSIDDIRIYNRTFSENEINSLYSEEKQNIQDDDYSNTCDGATLIALNDAVSARIDYPGQNEKDGDCDYFKIEIPEQMSVSIFTSGDTDTYGILFNCCYGIPPNCSIRIDDSNGGENNNFRINEKLDKGTYYFKVRHEDKINGTGDYTLHFQKDDEVDLNAGLVAYYPFNGNANDESGNGNDGVVNGATLTIDRYGNNDSAYLFDGDNDYIEIIDSDLLGVIHEMSICAWVKNDYIISKYDTSQRKLSFALSTKEQNKISFNVYTNMDNYYAFDTKYSTNIVENDYYFIVSTWKNNELKIFVNGEQQELINYSTGNFSDIQKNNIPILIGAIEYINGSRSFSKGCIDEIRFYNRALSEHEIINLYQKD
ncbi:protein containing Glycoside hydrolase, family 33, partial [Candidatus Magnetomorum sp. HK-1]